MYHWMWFIRRWCRHVFYIFSKYEKMSWGVILEGIILLRVFFICNSLRKFGVLNICNKIEYMFTCLHFFTFLLFFLHTRSQIRMLWVIMYLKSSYLVFIYVWSWRKNWFIVFFLLPFVMQFYFYVFYFLISLLFHLMVCNKIHNVTI